MKSLVLSVCATLLLFCMLSSTDSTAWSNGGKSASTSNPDHGTHDWIAHHALDWLPSEEKQYILSNLNAFLYGTELPDFIDTVDVAALATHTIIMSIIARAADFRKPLQRIGRGRPIQRR